MDPLIERLIALKARKKGVPPDVALQVMQQESSGNPGAVGDNGASLGLFQLQGKAAIDAGVDPERRGDVVPNIEGGVEYLRQQLQRSGGNVPLALEMYNKGPSLQGRGTPGYAQQVLARGGAPVDVANNRAVLEERLRAIRARKAASSASQQPPVADPQATSAPAVQSDLTIDIAKDAPQGPPVPEEGLPSREEIYRRIDAMLEEERQKANKAWQQVPGVALQTGGAVAGAVGGGMIGAPLLGGIVGGGLATRAGQALGLVPQETPVVETPVGNVYPSDMLGAAGGLLPLAGRLAKDVARVPLKLTRAVRALNVAEKKTAEQAAEYLAQYERQVAQETARAQGVMDDVAQRQGAQRRDWAFRVEAEQRKAATETGEQFAAWETREAEKLAEHARNVAQAQQVADDATQAADLALQQKNGAAYEAALPLQKQAIADYKQAVATFRTQRQQHQDAVKRLQALPEQYMPKVPRRTVADVERDLAFLEQGGTTAETVVKRLGVDDITAAGTKLADEWAALKQQGAAGVRRAEEVIASPHQQVAMPKDMRQELQSFIRQRSPDGRWGIRLEGEELAGDLSRYVSQQSVGKQPQLQNNQRGWTLQEMAERAHEEGFLTSPDKRELLDKLRESVMGKPAYRMTEPPPEPVQASSMVPAAAPPAPRGTQRASEVLYQRLDDIAGAGPVDLAPAREVASAVYDEVMQHMPSLQHTKVRKIVEDLANASTEGSVAQVHRDLKDLGPFLRGADPQTRYLIGQVVDGLQESLAQSAVKYPETTGLGRELLQQARAAWRQEHAVDEVRDLLKVGGPVLKRNEQGDVVMDVKALLNQMERLTGGVGSARHSFTARGGFPDETLASLKADVESFIGTPKLPVTEPELPGAIPVKLGTPAPPVAPKPVPLPEATPPPAPVVPVMPSFPVPAAPGRSTVPRDIPFEPPLPVEPTLEAPSARQLIRDAAYGVMFGSPGGPGMAAKVGAALAVGDMAGYWISKILLTPAVRPLLLRAIQPNGTIDPQMLGALVAIMQQLDPDYEPSGAPAR